MVKTHEINLSIEEFETFIATSHLIIEAGNIEVNDYILFKQTNSSGDATIETGLFQMAQVKSIITDDGLKDGYVMISVVKL